MTKIQLVRTCPKFHLSLELKGQWSFGVKLALNDNFLKHFGASKYLSLVRINRKQFEDYKIDCFLYAIDRL